MFPGIGCIPRVDPVDLRIGGPGLCRVKPHSKPWTVRLSRHLKEDEAATPLDIHDEKTRKCGGTLIGKKHVLTTASCVCPQGISSEENCTNWRILTAMVGDHDIRDEDDQQIIKIEGMVLHKNYTGIEFICKHSNAKLQKLYKA